MGLSEDDVREILRIVDEAGPDELRIETPGFRLHVVRGDAAVPDLGAAPAFAPRAAPAPAANGGAAPAAAPAPAGPTIDAPMLGTLYRAEAPGRPPYVDVGDRVEADTVVCLIEVMKMMNAVKAGMAGTVAEVCAANAQLVEFGQPLFRVTPDA